MERLSKYTTQIRTAITSSGSSGIQTDGGSPAKTLADPPTPFKNKNGSQHVSSYPTTGLGYYGLEAGQPDQAGNYNTEDAVWRLVLAIKSEGGFSHKEVQKKPDLIVVPSDGIKASVAGAIVGGTTGAVMGYFFMGGPPGALWGAYLGVNRGAVFGLGYYIYKEEYR